MEEPRQIVPPPWTLTGNGLILVCHFSSEFVRRHGFLADYQQEAYRGWFGTVMLVDYETSGVGPYRELLFIPGLFRLGDKMGFSISKIYVSTFDSVWNGIENWGIPKELADFHIVHNADGSTVHRVSLEGQTFFEIRTKAWGPNFPVSTRLFPLFRVLQQRRADLLLTRPVASGLARLTHIEDIKVNPGLFPDLSRISPLAVLTVENFRMTFPLADRIG